MKNKFNISKLLEDSKSSIYSWATNDLTCLLAMEVMSIGYTKMKLFYDDLGEDPEDLIVIFGPDGSTTRNKTRFDEGVGYGCVIATKKYIFPSLLHPNACGFGLYRIDELPNRESLIKKLNHMKMHGVPIGDKRGKWDVWKSNHFIDLLQLDHLYYDTYQKILLPGKYVLIHSSQQTEKNKLSYWEPNDFITIETPLGKAAGLEGKSASEYLEYFKSVEQYSKAKRTSIANELFGEENVYCVSNPTHQGYFVEGEYYVMRLGLYNTQSKSGSSNLSLFPLGFNGYSSIYLYEGLENIKDQFWNQKEIDKAKELNHLNFIRRANIMPHGGGYKLFYPHKKVRSVYYENQIFFELFDSDVQSKLLIQDIEALEYGYRVPEDIIPLVDKYELGRQIATFSPEYVIKF